MAQGNQSVLVLVENSQNEALFPGEVLKAARGQVLRLESS